VKILLAVTRWHVVSSDHGSQPPSKSIAEPISLSGLRLLWKRSYCRGLLGAARSVHAAGRLIVLSPDRPCARIKSRAAVFAKATLNPGAGSRWRPDEVSGDRLTQSASVGRRSVFGMC